jgi:hypothetical protein
MAVDYTTTALIESVKRRVSVPTSQALFANLDFCKIATDELQSVIAPLVLAEQEDYFLHAYDQTIDGVKVAYDLPDRAIGQKLQDAGIYNETTRDYVTKPRLRIEDYGSPYGDYVEAFSGYYIENDQIIFKPTLPASSDKLRIFYYRRPNNLVRTSDAGKITNINTSTKVVSLDNLPTTWTTSTSLDLIKGSGGFRSLSDDFTGATIAGFDITLSELPDGIAVGDYISEAGQSPIPQIPYEGHHLLAQLVAIKVLESLGDAKGMQLAMAKYQEMLKSFTTTITSRVEASPQRVVGRGNIFHARRRSY